MADVAELGIELDSSQLQKGSASLGAVEAMAKRAGVAVEEMQKRINAANGTLKQTGPATAQANAQFDAMVKETADLSAQVKLLEAQMGKAGTSMKGVNEAGLSVRSTFRLMGREASLFSPQIAEVIRLMGTLAQGGSRLGIGFSAAVLGIAAVGAALYGAVSAFSTFEDKQARAVAALQLTGNVSGQTATSLDQLARKLSDSGTVTRDAVVAAEQELLKFRDIGSGAFEQVLQIAKEASAGGFTDMKGAVQAIGNAIKDIPNAADALSAANLKLSSSTQQAALALAQQGKQGSAAKLILDELAKTTGGADAAAAGTLGSAWNRLKDVTGDTAAAFGEWISKGVNLVGVMDSVTEATKRNVAAQQEASGLAANAPAVTAANQPLVSTNTAEQEAAIQNQKRLEKAIQDANIELDKSGKIAGMSAVQIAIYNETVAKMIPLESAAGQAIAQRVSAQMSANDFRATIDGLKQQAAASDIAAKASGMSAGAAAQFTAVETAKQNAIIKGIPLTNEQTKAVEEQAKKIGAATSASGKNVVDFSLKLQNMADKGLISEQDVRIVQQLEPLFGQNIPAALNSSEAGMIRFHNEIQRTKDMTASFIDTFVQGMVNGDGAVKALGASLSGLGQSMTQFASKQLAQSFSSSISGALGGAAGAFGGPLATLAVGAGVSLIGKLFGADNNGEEQKKQQAAAEAERQRQEREKVIAEAQIRAADYSLRAANAMEKSGFIVQIRQFDAESQKAFDEESKRAGDVAIWQLVAARAAERTKLIADTIDAATDTLAGAEMSDVQTRLKEINDAAIELGNALIETGQNATDAAEAVSEKLNKSLADLKSTFVDDLARKVNDLAGGSWINDLSDLLKEVAQLKQDAGSLGVDPGLIDSFTVLSAQKIVDSAKLTGDAFSRVQMSIGDLGSNLHEFGSVVEDTANTVKRSIEEIANAIQSNEDRLFNALHRSDSLSDQLARFDLQAQREREAEAAAGGQAMVSLEAALQQERLNLINDFNQQQLQAQQQAAEEALRAQQQAAEEQQRIAKEASDFLTGALQNISNFIQHFFAVASPSQSPAAALASSQSSFATQKTLALSGNRDALTGITQNAQDVINAATAYYGSSAAGQAIISNVIAQLQSLPTQVSAEQFIVNGVTTSIQTQTTSLNDTLGGLQAAMLSGNPQAVAAALSPYFNNLDINTDGLLDFNEFQQGLAGMASNGALRDMFTRLDTDNSGSISRLELINQATQQNTSVVGQVQSNTQNTAANTQATATNAGNTAANVSTGNSVLQALNTNTAWLQFIQTETALSNSNEASTLATLNGIANFTGAISSWAPGSNHATGGYITGPGTSTSDSIPAMLSAGEGVIRASRVAELGGKSWVDNVNAGGSAGNDNAMSNSLLRRLISAEVGGAQEVAQEVRALRSDMQEGAKATKRDRWRKAG